MSQNTKHHVSSYDLGMLIQWFHGHKFYTSVQILH